MTNRGSTEQQLFEFHGWDQFDTAGFTFYDTKLRVAIAEFPVGTEFPVVNVDYERSILELLQSPEGPARKFDLRLSVGEEIK